MMDAWDWVWGMLMMLLFWGGLVVAVVVGVRLFADRRRTSEPEDASVILRNRYARGEITDEEFEARMSVLDSSDRLRVGRDPV